MNAKKSTVKKEKKHIVLKCSLQQVSLVMLLLVYRRDGGYKNDVRAARRETEEETVFDELFDPEGLRVAYITIASSQTQIPRAMSDAVSFPRFKCVHVQELPTHHVRAKECRRLCQAKRSRGRSVGRLVGRSVWCFCEFALQNYDGTNPHASVRSPASSPLGCQNAALSLFLSPAVQEVTSDR